uniref:Rieske domain-containing protein n=1 Tax=Oryza barthii TaxID=65489 RepID=A0A0D3FQE8_9ORYZ
MAPFSLHLLFRARTSLPLRHGVPRPRAASLAPRRRLRQPRCTSTGRLSSMPAPSAETETVAAPPVVGAEERFEWLDQWYPVAPVCDLDPRRPHGKMVMGLSVVAWLDGGGEWRVVDDACPHRLAPLSEGRVDGKGRLLCAYHGWCFDGHGSCQFIPQAPALGPPVHKNSKACVASYPSVVQNNILWFYPRSEPEYCDVLKRKRPPYVPEIDDDDPSHFMVYGMSCWWRTSWTLLTSPTHTRGFLADEVKKKMKKKPEVRVVLFTVPVAPGRSRFIWASRYKVGGWLDKILPRWFYHMTSNTILDSDTYLHVEDRNITTVGLDNWHKACYVPTSSDNLVIAYRNWFRKYCNHQIGWANPNPTVKQQLPQTPTRDQLLERYWSHVMQCTSCRAALKGMRALEITLQVAAVAVVGFLAAGKETAVMSGVQRAAVVAAAVLCFAASRWLANFIEKTFYFQDYVHADK